MYSEGNIVRHVVTGQVYEISKIFATHALGKAVLVDNTTSLKEEPINLSECELILDSATDAFNVLFEDNE